MVLYILSGGDQAELLVATIVSSAIIFVFMSMLYYNNVSYNNETTTSRNECWIILILSLCNMIIDVATAMNSFSPILGFIYVLVVVGFLFIDAIKVKSRVFTIGFGSLFTIFNLYCIYNTFGTWAKVLFIVLHNTR